MKFTLALIVFTIFTMPSLFSQDFDLEFFASGFSNPVNIKHAGDNKLYVVEQDGYIKIVQPDGSIESTAFLNIDNLVIDTGNERGLLGLAFHPDYETNGYFFVNYIDNLGNTVVSRFTRDATNPLLADINSEFNILSFDQPYSNHNGGDLAFGADGFLYISTGDGGSGGDPLNNAQNTLNYLGKILRIDINATTPIHNYSIPADNPFVGNPNVNGEIWAYGLRNPWKFSFDRLNGDIWIADVGQNAYEEINFATAANAAVGLNYGWRCYEGNAVYNSDDCSEPNSYTYPIGGYNHFGDGESKCSITGGYRYRGTAFPNLTGLYFFADYCSQEIGFLNYDETNDTWLRTLNDFNGNWSAFGEDFNGELYVSDLTSGSIYKIIDNTLGVDQNSLSSISVYPNPIKNEVHINFGINNTNQLYTTILIFDLQGKLIKSIPRSTNTIQKIETSDISEGIYLLNIQSTNGEQSIHKLVKN
ncbi:PQQ-dependent sugar dehydrogenase [Winogradskyella eckloniae]|uniref:PQQ-dependent sugar dehydrogenase n=1 Tax=Winogradskyella eckloniae TaxID=1089306 RepID=UPI001563D604|nr:PQQ-dependent sugar dehydrogenase [Winogradskyella eckloniae]NRD21131.1 PQQ-dependent sugar dehydrogenase [Winogradskyella eckloniae]